MREFCAGHACSPESSGRQWQGGGGNTFEGSPSSPMFSRFLGSVLLRPGLRAHRTLMLTITAFTSETCSVVSFSGAPWLRDLQWTSWC